MKSRYIFDLDGTLLDSDYSGELEYFKQVLTTDESDYFIPKIASLLDRYESSFTKYDIHKLSRFMSLETSIKITPEIIKGWIEVGKESNDMVVDGTFELLEELKRENKEIVLLTNWFSTVQSERAKNAGIIDYIDEIYGGEIALKPNPDSYKNACGKTPMELCVMIGNDYKKDIVGSEIVGLDNIFFNRKDEHLPVKNSVKSLRKIKSIY